MDKNILFYMRNMYIYKNIINMIKIYKWYISVYLWYGIIIIKIDF